MTDNALGYRITIGSQTLSHKANDNERLLLKAVVQLSMDGYGNRCELLLGDAENTAPKAQDAVTVELDNGAGMKKVFTGTVDSVSITATQQRVIAFDALNRLNNVYVESSYEKVDVGYVVKDLLSQGSVSVGTIETGFKLSAWLAYKQIPALAHLQQFAYWCGADLYSDNTGKVQFTLAKNTGTAHSFQYGQAVRELSLYEQTPLYDSVEVIGEGAASSQGAEKFYWLAKDVSGVSGKAMIAVKTGQVSTGKLGNKPRRLVLGAIRSQESAKQVAENILQALASRWLSGRLLVMGSPEIQLADSIKVTDLPKQHSAVSLLNSEHKLRVRGIRHTLDRTVGLMTELTF
ncbi:MAG: hypothetical protein WAX77_03850 [Methylococcaceae bacterium]